MRLPERLAEQVDHWLSRSPIVTRRTLLERERNAFVLGLDYGAYTGRGLPTGATSPRPNLRVVTA